MIQNLCFRIQMVWQLRHVRDGKESLHGTKSGKSRSVPVAEDLFNEIHGHIEKFREFIQMDTG